MKSIAAASASSLAPRKTVTAQNRESYEKTLGTIARTAGDVQLSFFNELAASTPSAYLNLFEFFDAVPKFVLTPQTSLRKGESLQIKKFSFQWGDETLIVSIAPVVVETKDRKTQESIRKEVLPGPREETIYRVLKRMITDPEIEKQARERAVVIRFSLNQLRARLSDVHHEFRISEIKEGLQILSRSPLQVRLESKKKELFSGSYIGLAYVSDVDDETGLRSTVEVTFNALAAAAITARLYDRIHYPKLMSLSPLGAWIYELLTRNFRQAAPGMGFKLSLSRVMRESGLPPRKSYRENLQTLRAAIKELVEGDVLAFFPPVKEDIQYVKTLRPAAGRKAIEDVVFTIYPSESVTKDIISDNSHQLARRTGKSDPINLK